MSDENLSSYNDDAYSSEFSDHEATVAYFKKVSAYCQELAREKNLSTADTQVPNTSRLVAPPIFSSRINN